MTFEECFTLLLGHEGGYSNHPDDPGGETIWGITVAVARQNGYSLAMKDMPVSVAQDIYRKRYWVAAKCDQLPAVIRYSVFDAAVNSGVTQAVKWLQRAIRVQDDGIIGDKTLSAVSSNDANLVVRRMLGQRLKFMTELKSWDSFGKGWSRRIASLLDM